MSAGESENRAGAGSGAMHEIQRIQKMNTIFEKDGGRGEVSKGVLELDWTEQMKGSSH